MFDVLTIKEVQISMGKWCQSLRKTEGLTQAELAKKLAVSRLTISQLERGKNFTITTFLKVLLYFDEIQMFQEFIKQHLDRPASLY